MIVDLTSLALAAALSAQASVPQIALPPAPPSPALVEAVSRVGLGDLPDVVLIGYPVTGRSPGAIRESMNAARPTIEVDGERHDARTGWIYQTRWQSGPDHACLPATATVTVVLRMVLPDLTTRDQLSPPEKAGWDAYFEALVTHERNHGRIVVAGQEQMQAAMRASPTCEAMNAMIQTTSAEVRAASEEYDRQTDHGRREGAVYPRPGA